MVNCAFNKNDKCIALVNQECKGCSFRKTKEELLEGRRRARTLLERLPQEQRNAIENKYYGNDNVRHEI